LIGGADAFTSDSMDGFRAAAKAILGHVPAFDLQSMRAEQDRLAERQKLLGGCEDAVSMWKILGIDDPEAVSAMDTDSFVELANGIKGASHDAR
ncbi:MAG: biotin-independent malonate decarboxylase subunit beta, partial [Janthinobacterium lividum]